MLVVANYKMNGNAKFYATVQEKLNSLRVKGTKIVLCPPFVYLSIFKKSVHFALASQDISLAADSKSTGQISAQMLKEFNVQYCLIGHSERREIGETDAMVAKKVENACQNGIIPIICVGEKSKADKQSGIANQVKKALESVGKQEIVFAYEPVWAIGTGETPSCSHINRAAKIIRDNCKKLGYECKVLYGGSVNEKNYSKFLPCEIDGFLIGGASKNIDEFINIVKGCVR